MFTRFMCIFELALMNLGYGVTDGEAWRSPETAALYEKEGKGISNSLHLIRLARDINLFKSGIIMKTVSDYLEAGLLWEAYSTQSVTCCWGGRFLRPDADHFSFSHNGVK